MTDQQKTVCILDDDPDMRKALERVLSVHGYRPCSFASIAEFHADARPQEALCTERPHGPGEMRVLGTSNCQR